MTWMTFFGYADNWVGLGRVGLTLFFSFHPFSLPGPEILLAALMLFGWATQEKHIFWATRRRGLQEIEHEKKEKNKQNGIKKMLPKYYSHCRAARAAAVEKNKNLLDLLPLISPVFRDFY